MILELYLYKHPELISVILSHVDALLVAAKS
jgi:hypothetical protein